MPTNFPTSLDFLSNPSASSSLASPSHAGQHADANDAIEALQAKVGVNNSAVTSSLDYKVRNPELVGGAARPLLTGGAYLDGTTGLVTGGLSGNFASVPAAASGPRDITGDIDIKVKVALTDWTPATRQTLAAKWSGSLPGTSYQFAVLQSFGPNSAGALEFRWYNSSNTLTAVSTTSSIVGASDGSSKWVRATLDVDNGSSQNVVKFYTSDDGNSWTQLGTTVTTAGTTNIASNSTDIRFGQRDTEPLAGTIHRTIIQSAFDTADNTTSVVFNANFETATADALAFTESSSNAATVTIKTTRYTVGVPGLATINHGTGAIVSGVDRYWPFIVTSPIQVDLAQFEVTTGPSSSANVYIACYATNDDCQPTGAPLFDTGAISVSSSATGIFRKQFTAVTLQPGTYLLGLNVSVNMTLRRTFMAGPAVSLDMGAAANIIELFLVRTAGAFPSSTSWNSVSIGASGLGVYALLRWRAA